VVPSGDSVENIWVGPFTGLKVKDNQVSELRFGVPTTVGVKLVINDKDGVTTTTNGRRLGLLHWQVLMPCLGLQVEAEDVSEGGACVVETTMATIDIDLVVVVGGSHVGTRRRCSDGRLFVGGSVTISLHSLPVDLRVVGVWNLEEPAVIESQGRTGVTTEDEDLLLRREDGGVLGTWLWLLFAVRNFLFPM
jgi:hypothetical protein